MFENYIHFLEQRDRNYEVPVPCEIDSILAKYAQISFEYQEFLLQINGGFFFNNALHIYSISDKNIFGDIFYINNFFKNEYPEILAGEFFFGQDIFGNQFGIYHDGVLFFNIETGEKTHLADGFYQWMDLVLKDLDYYSGQSLAQLWYKENRVLSYNERLCPKMPFVIGGEYEIVNLYSLPFPSYISVNSNIAKQIFHLPDGSSFKINITP